MAVSVNWVHFLGVVIKRALFFWVYIGALDLLETPHIMRLPLEDLCTSAGQRLEHWSGPQGTRKGAYWKGLLVAS